MHVDQISHTGINEVVLLCQNLNNIVNLLNVHIKMWLIINPFRAGSGIFMGN